jgi:hypothetical protein
LRLWIELLKNAYYSDNGELTTLPNIDINIKVGDSLIHRFQLDASFDLRKNKFKDYLSWVKQYKNTSDKAVKANINQDISKIKNEFFGSFRTPAGEKLDRALAKLSNAGQVDLFKKTDIDKLKVLRKRAEEAREAFNKSKDDPVFKDSMEWRIEFPEVLDESGEFIGWDIVIANPPYIFARNQSFDEYTKRYYLSHYTVDEYQANTYTLFMELGYNLLKAGGTFAYIVPNNMLTIQSNQKIRNFLINKTGHLEIINSMDKLFADANVDNCLVFFKKEKPTDITVGELDHGEYNTIGTVNHEFFGDKNPIFSISMVKYKNAINAFWKINSSSILSNYADVKTGIKAYQVGKGKSKLHPGSKMTKEDRDGRVYHSKEKIDDSYLPYIDGNNVQRYYLKPSSEYIKYSDCLAEPRKSTNFSEPRILVRQIPNKGDYAIDGAFTDTTIINDINSMVIENIKKLGIFPLLGILNSKPETLWFLMKFDKFQRRLFPQFKVNELAQFPIPPLNDKDKVEAIAELVKVIMDKKKKQKDADKENKRVDELVMDLFQLSEADKQSIRDFTFKSH